VSTITASVVSQESTQHWMLLAAFFFISAKANGYIQLKTDLKRALWNLFYPTNYSLEWFNTSSTPKLNIWLSAFVLALPKGWTNTAMQPQTVLFSHLNTGTIAALGVSTNSIKRHQNTVGCRHSCS